MAFPSHPKPIADLGALLAGLQPRLQPGVYIFASLSGGRQPRGLAPLATFHEAEGLSLIVEASAADAAGLTPLGRMAWITLDVHSDLMAVGLTAAVAGALAGAGISCNVVAAARHDHLFVPLDRAAEAMAVLGRLSAGVER